MNSARFWSAFITRNSAASCAEAEYTVRHIAGARFIGYERGGHVRLGHHREIVGKTAAFVRNAAH